MSPAITETGTPNALANPFTTINDIWGVLLFSISLKYTMVIPAFFANFSWVQLLDLLSFLIVEPIRKQFLFLVFLFFILIIIYEIKNKIKGV